MQKKERVRGKSNEAEETYREAGEERKRVDLGDRQRSQEKQ